MAWRSATPSSDPNMPRAGRPGRLRVLAWRAGIGQQLRQAGLVSSELAWREDIASPYYTDKPAWDCYGALQLLAAHEEAPSRLSWRNRYPKRLADGWNRDRILTRLSNGKTKCRYSHLYGVEVWLPVEFTGVFEAPLPNGHPTRFGSGPQLLAQLHELNRRTYQGTPDDRAAWRAAQPDGVHRAIRAQSVGRPCGHAGAYGPRGPRAASHAARLLKVRYRSRY